MIHPNTLSGSNDLETEAPTILAGSTSNLAKRVGGDA